MSMYAYIIFSVMAVSTQLLIIITTLKNLRWKKMFNTSYHYNEEIDVSLKSNVAHLCQSYSMDLFTKELFCVLLLLQQNHSYRIHVNSSFISFVALYFYIKNVLNHIYLKLYFTNIWHIENNTDYNSKKAKTLKKYLKIR